MFQFRQVIVDNFNEDGTNIYNMSQAQFRDIQEKIRKKLAQWNMKTVTIKNLSHFSPWLAKYNIRDYVPNTCKPDETNRNWLEVPGQYNNVTARPFPEKHIKIFKFDSNIQVNYTFTEKRLR